MIGKEFCMQSKIDRREFIKKSAGVVIGAGVALQHGYDSEMGINGR